MAEYIATLTDDAALQQAAADKYIAAIREKQEKMDAIEALELEDDVAFWNDVKARLAQPVAVETQTEEVATAQAPEAIPTPMGMDDVAVQDVEESTPSVDSSTSNVDSSISVPESQIENENGNDSQTSESSESGARLTNEVSNEEVQLSDEVDENGRQFVLNSKGEIVFGEIAEDTGLTPAPILLSEGLITNHATNDGYGLVHIEARHGEQIRNAGYNSVVAFVEEVAKNYERIREGINRDGHQTYMLQLTDKHNNTLMVELSGDGTYWNINTAGIFKTSYGKNRKEVYNRHTTAKQPTETVEVSQDVEQSGTQTSSGMNTPTTSSTAESTTQSSNVQENSVKSGENAQNEGENHFEEESEPGARLTNEVGNEEVTQTNGLNNNIDDNVENNLQNGINDLNLQQENVSNNGNKDNTPVGGQVPESVPQGEYGEVSSLLGGAQETAARLRERIESAQGNSKSGLREVENSVTREFAQENGLWIEDEFKLGVPFPSGDEHNNYIDAEKQVVYKVNNRMHTPSILDLLDRIEHHNKLFPNSKYSLVGFTAISENGDVMPVFAQNFVSDARMASIEEIDGYMGALGFTRVGDGRYSNGGMLVKDLKPRNVLVNENGDVFVVDAEFEAASQESRENRSQISENTQNVGEKDVIEEMREQNRVAEERQQRAGVPPRMSDYSAAISAGDANAQKAWEDRFNDYLNKLTADDLSTVESTISRMQGNKEAIKAGNPAGYMENPNYKAFDNIEKMLKKRKSELEKSSTNEEKRQDVEEKSTTGGAQAEQTENANLQTERQTEPTISQESEQVSETDAEEDDTVLSESEYADARSAEIMADNPNLDDVEAYNMALDEYPKYIGDMINSGKLSKIYKKANIGERIALNKSIQAAGYEISDVNAQEVKEGSKKAESKFKVGDEVTATFGDGSVVSGAIEKIEDGRIKIRSNGRLYPVDESKIGKGVELQRGSLSLDGENPAFKAATEKTMQALQKTGVEVVMATEEQVQAVMEIADDERQMIADANERFNRELQQQIDGTLPKGHIYELGMPSAVLQSAGLPYLPIELAASRLSDKSMQENHPFELSEIEGLVEGVQNPLAVFRSATHVGSFVVLTEIQHNGRNFVVAIETNRRQGRIEINSVRSVYPKNNAQVANWIVEGLLEYADKKRMSEWFSKQQSNSADVRNLFRHSAKVVESFENPKVSAEFSRVYHGSGAKFDRFDHSFMGMGEGAQAFGWGTYVTEVEGIGRTYATSAARGKNIDYEKTSHAIAEALEKKIGIPTGSLYIMYDGRRLELEVVNGNNIREKLSEYTGIPIDEKDAIRHALAEDAADLIEEYEHIGQRYRYTVEIPDDNGSNYLHWEGVVSDDVIDNLQSELQKNFGEEVAISANLKHGQGGEYLYKKMERALGSDKAASEFLSRAGFVGISYPAQATTGGRADGARNFVIFNENDAQITDRVEFLRTSEGTVYGWSVGGRIYLTPEGVNPNTPVHEYTHLWASAIEQRSPELWAEVVEAVKLSPAWAEVAADEAYRNIWNDESRMASEVLARLSGGENYRRTMQEAAERENDAARKFSLIAAWGRVKRALAKFWNKVREMLDLPVNGEPGNAVPAWERFVNSAIGDFYRGVNPNVGNSPMERMMGSRVDARMAQVASELDGRELTTEQQAVADVFGGKADNLTISVKTRDGSERKFVMRQGNEANAGAKHSLFRHYGTNNGTITVDDILLIPEIIANGERTEKKRGNKTVIEYKHTDNNGVEYTVLTEKNKGREEFANFYTNRKASPSARKTRSEEARASNGNASTDKGSNNSSNLQEDDNDIRYRSFGGNSGYVGYSMSKRAAEARREGRYPKTDFKKEYGVSGKSFDFLRKAGIISSSEWHHTSKFGNRTDFFSWSNDTDAEYYAANKKRIDKAINDVEKLKPEYDVMKAIDKYLSEGRSQDEISALIDEESRQVEPAEKRYKDARNALAEQLNEEFYNYYNEDFYKNYEQKSEAASHDADIRYRATDVDAEAERTDAEITAAVERLSTELNTPVEIVTNLSTSPDGRKRASKGWYEGGRVYLVLPNAESVQDAVETVLHEVVGHRGLRALFGERFDAMLDDVFTGSSKAVRSAIMERALPLIGRGRDNAIRVATEEYMAEQAERGFDDYSLWDKVRGWFRNMLRSMGLDVEIGDNEIRYMLWRSYRRMKRGETFAEELNNKIMEARFRNGDGTIAKYESRVNTRGLSAYNAREAFQDEMLALKEFQRIVEEKYGEKIPSYLNVYDYENRMSSVGFREFMTFSEQLYEPLQETIDEMFREGATQEDVTAYLIAKSGLERNRDFSVRDYLAKMQESKETPEGVTDAVAPMTKAEADAKMNEYMAEKARLLAELNAGSIVLFAYILHENKGDAILAFSNRGMVASKALEAGSKVILARLLFFGDFPFFTFELGKLSFCRHKSLMPPDNIPNTLL